jgi:signal transduction histidine kinase
MKTNIRFATDILLRLGEELNPNADQGIIELVKNGYDADAATCTIELKNIDTPGGTIRVKDDGDGMEISDIVDGWLLLGRSQKVIGKRTRLKRIPAGNKGLGRLAALRLGNKVLLNTRPRKNPHIQYTLQINWADFENVIAVEDITLQIDQSSIPNGKPGTEILIEGLAREIGRAEVKRLARSLILLADPFVDSPDSFNPILYSDEFKDLERLVSNRYFDDAEYHLVASLDIDGKAKAEVTDFKGRRLFTANHKDLTSSIDKGFYDCAPVQFDFWVFILNKETFSTRNSSLAEVKEWLQAFGGVHLYQNGLRVNPYGNPGNDWLDINLARTRSPEERPSTNTSIGRVSLTDPQNLLVQKTDRSGFIETESFHELRRFAVDALEWFASKRLQEAEKRRRREKKKVATRSEKAAKRISDAIGKLPPTSRRKVQTAFKAYDKARVDEVNNLQKEVQLYRTLSTAGITAATFAHESAGNPLKVIGQTAKSIERRGRLHLGDKYDAILKEPVEIILQSTEALKVLGNVTLSLIEQDKRRPTRVDIHERIMNVVRMFKPFTEERRITVMSELSAGQPYLRGSDAAVESIITNLINNSIFWLERSTADQLQIIIRTKVEGESFTLKILDNGPGIQGIDKNDIWLPGKTTRPNGTGLGLTIVRDTVDDLGGEVSVVEKGELGGAEIEIRLPLLGSD